MTEKGLVLVTGGTGFLGTQMCLRLIEDSEHDLVCLVRAPDQASAELRLRRAWTDWPHLEAEVGGRVEALRADLTEERLGLDGETHGRLVGSLTHIIHSAADMRLDGPLEELRRTNVGGTRNILELARAAHADHGLTRLSHVSTAYVAGARTGEVPEDSLSDEHGFYSRYEVSKFEGEQLVKEARAELPISVFRPGLVVGDSRTGAIKTFNTIYFPLKLYMTGRLRVLPAKRSLKVNLIPVDYVAEAVVRLTLDERAEGLNFHLTAPWEDLPTAGELMDMAREWTRDNLGVRLKRPLFVPSPVRATRGRYKAQQAVTRERTGFLEGLITLAPYFNERRRFRRDNVDRLLGRYELRWREVLPRLFEYSAYLGFLHRTDRTVHEQILFRMRGRRFPVTYHDVAGGTVTTRDSAEVRREMLATAGALAQLGVGPGDRVALVGLNSSRYLTIDVGIGLLGAAGVPLYYTSPPEEIARLLEASGARVLLVGSPKVLSSLGDALGDVTVVSFCREGTLESLPEGVVPWMDFLAMGKGRDVPETAPVDLHALATIRYTSGTTGTPKGVTFEHENLRWMGVTLASLLEWEMRNRDVTYLSFLPMNHVVEGILAAYAPYYAPAPVDIYFLEDFRELQDVLPRIRPTVFFAVPRFFEKVWEALMDTGPGQSYAAAGEGLKKGLLRRLIRKAVLRRAGLDRASQLLVGSAPIAADLVRQFQGLGIEVHNAYGLTEAPLVSMNRPGRNRPETVGEPLPETELVVEEDGEVLVKGPQVTPGYFEDDVPSPLRGGYLLTGDVGLVTEEGHLRLHGRKKEILVTSYGKNIHPSPIEGMLRDIQGVDEVMLLGEGRPYVGALLWVDGGSASDGLVEGISRAIADVNQRLSHAEQIKRWAVLENDLSIDCGDLTASLKLKRQAVTERLRPVINHVYGDGDGAALPECFIDLGGGG